VGRGEQLHAGRDLTRRANYDLRHVQHHRIDVHERPVADADPAVLAEEGRPHDDAFAHVPQRLTQQLVALRPLPRRRAVEPGQQLLDPLELGRVVGIVADVQLAAQHPLSHIAHAPLSPGSAARGVSATSIRAGSSL
jgi:hypothetical protein